VIPFLHTQAAGPKSLLLAVPAPVEIRGILSGLHLDLPVPGLWDVKPLVAGVDILHCGVGKANAAGALAKVLAENPGTYAAVMNAGIAGALPPSGPGGGLGVGDLAVATSCVFGDEGIVTPKGYESVAQMGFPMNEHDGGMSFLCDQRLVDSCRRVGARPGPIATVSICSGTDAVAREIAGRTGALAESMEGAALALVAHRWGLPMTELRAMSNFTGDRAEQQWDIRRALSNLGQALRTLLDVGDG
jgi:futalosine hydrolase